MSYQYINESDEERSRRHRERIERMREQKRRAEIMQKRVFPGVLVTAMALTLIFILRALNGGGRTSEREEASVEVGAGNVVVLTQQQLDREEEKRKPVTQESGATGNTEVSGSAEAAEEQQIMAGSVQEPEAGEAPQVYAASSDSATVGFPEEVISTYGVLIDVERSAILAQEEGKTRISPASMTKILTLLTAANALGIGGEDWENSPVLDEKFTITIDITDYSFVNDCSNVGFEIGEEVTVRDLFYGTILPSGADAALGLACYVAGSHEAFVELMNQELEKMEMSDTTHFTNCVGLYDKDHYSTVYDIAVILKTAADNPFCRDVLSAHTYNTSSTQQHEEGILVSNWFLRRIEDKDTNGEVLCAKTGFVNESKSCAASLATDKNGREYICVTAGADSSWKCIYDQVALYRKWLEE